jgi:hypothetical protein
MSAHEEWNELHAKTWGRSSRCPECSIKQGDLSPVYQPLKLTAKIKALEAQLTAQAEELRTKLGYEFELGEVRKHRNELQAHLTAQADELVALRKVAEACENLVWGDGDYHTGIDIGGDEFFYLPALRAALDALPKEDTK